MYVGIDQQSGLVYEGLEGPVLPVVGISERTRSIPSRERVAGGFSSPRPHSRRNIGSYRTHTKILMGVALARKAERQRICTPTRRASRCFGSRTGAWG